MCTSFSFCALGVQDLLTYARIQPVMNQIEVHPFMRNQYNIDFCHSKGIKVGWAGSSNSKPLHQTMILLFIMCQTQTPSPFSKT